MENETLDKNKDFEEFSIDSFSFYEYVRQYFYYCFDLVFMSLELGSFPDYCSDSDWKPGIHLLHMKRSIQIQQALKCLILLAWVIHSAVGGAVYGDIKWTHD